MTEHHITPEKVTKPIQLLAAWLVGLILVNASFLLAAQQITNPSWGSAVLVIAAVANVPIFIAALFLLQTKFRPQMQEDSYYSQYLKSQREYSVQRVEVGKPEEAIEKAITIAAGRITSSLGVEGSGQEKPIENILRESQVDTLVEKLGGSRSLSELYLSTDTWNSIVERWGEEEAFDRDMDQLIFEGLVTKKGNSFFTCRLTELGLQVAQAAEKQQRLWSQLNKSYWDDEHTAQSKLKTSVRREPLSAHADV